jgi:hypothetical protein
LPARCRCRRARPSSGWLSLKPGAALVRRLICCRWRSGGHGWSVNATVPLYSPQYAGARGKEPCSMQLPMQASSDSYWTSCVARRCSNGRAAGLNFARPVNLPTTLRPRSGHPRRRYGAVQHHGAQSQQIVVKLFRRMSRVSIRIELGRYLTETVQTEYARFARHRGIEENRTRRSRRVHGSWRIRVTPDGDQCLSRPLCRNSDCSRPRRWGR